MECPPGLPGPILANDFSSDSSSTDTNETTSSEENKLTMLASEATPMRITYEQKTITRDEAMAKFWPIIKNFEENYLTYQFIWNIRETLSKETVKVLPSGAKAMIRLAASFVKNSDIVQWIDEAKDDIKDHTWTERVEVPQSSADRAHAICLDLKTIADAAPPDIQNLLRIRVQMTKELLQTQEERIQELASKIEHGRETEISQMRCELAEVRSLVGKMLKRLPQECSCDEHNSRCRRKRTADEIN